MGVRTPRQGVGWGGARHPSAPPPPSVPSVLEVLRIPLPSPVSRGRPHLSLSASRDGAPGAETVPPPPAQMTARVRCGGRRGPRRAAAAVGTAPAVVARTCLRERLAAPRGQTRPRDKSLCAMTGVHGVVTRWYFFLVCFGSAVSLTAEAGSSLYSGAFSSPPSSHHPSSSHQPPSSYHLPSSHHLSSYHHLPSSYHPPSSHPPPFSPQVGKSETSRRGNGAAAPRDALSMTTRGVPAWRPSPPPVRARTLRPEPCAARGSPAGAGSDPRRELIGSRTRVARRVDSPCASMCWRNVDQYGTCRRRPCRCEGQKIP